MRKTLFVLLLALALCLPAACGSQGEESTPTDAPAVDTEESSGTDLILPGDPGYEEDSATDTQDTASGEDWTALEPEDCVEDLASYEGMVPRISLDCPGAEAINAQIEERFVPLVGDPSCEGLYYECAKGAGRVLSVLMVEHGPNDTTFFTPYNLDLATGEALTGEQLLALLEVDAEELKNLEQALLGEEFTHQFGDVKDDTDPEFYDGQYERTTDPDNTQTDRLWFSGDGMLCFAGCIYGMAGAECYEYSIGTGMIF